jgi:hypothetical protein
MNKLRTSAWTLLLIVLLGIGIANSQSVGSSQRVLAYSAKPSPHPSSFLLKSPRGVTYRLSLVPEPDVKKHVVVLDLVLQKPGQTEDDPNLLDSTGNLHGYQPHIFAASDFAGGAQKSAYGESRVIDLPKLGMQMRVKVSDVHVEPTSAGSSQGLGYQFDDLTLEMTTQSVAEGRSNKLVH